MVWLFSWLIKSGLSKRMTLISELTSLSRDLTVQLYCLAIYMQPYRCNKLFVTDFTSNPIITGPYTQNYDLCNKNLKTMDMLFLLECFPETWNPLIASYKNFHKQDLCENSFLNELNNYEIDSKVCFLKVNVKLKTYRGVLEGKLLTSELMMKDKSQGGREFYERFFLSVSNSFIIKNNVVLKELLPEEFWPKIERALNEEEEDEFIRNTQVKLDEEEDVLRADRFNSDELKSSPPPLENDELLCPSSQIPHNSQLDKATAHKDPMLIAPGQSPQPLHFLPLSSPTHSYPPSFTGTAAENDRPSFLPISQLNQVTKIDSSTYYRTKAFIVGTIPEDLSLVCVKSYDLDSTYLRYKVGDPYLRELQIIICDQDPSEKGRLALNDSNSLKITLQGEDILSFFNHSIHDYVETFYTKVDLYNHPFNTYLMENRRKLMDIKLVRKLIHSDRIDIPIWVSEDLSMNSILGQSNRDIDEKNPIHAS